jgi:hypothetical protein
MSSDDHQKDPFPSSFLSSCSSGGIGRLIVPPEPICLWQHRRAQRKSNPCPVGTAAKGGAEPRASHPEKAPQAPGWVSMVSGVDGASTLVSLVQIGAGFFTFCLSCNT